MFFDKPDVEKLKIQQNVQGLIKALRYRVKEANDVHIREVAAKALGDIGDKRAVEPLIDALNYQAPVARAAAEALGQIGDPRAVPPLIDNLLKYKDLDIESIVIALGKIGDQRAIKPLVSALTHKVSQTRMECAKALDKLGWHPDTDNSENGAAYWVAKQEWDYCIKFGTNAVKPLILALRSDFWSLKGDKFEGFGLGPVPDLFGKLIVSNELRVVEAAAGTLIKIGKPAVKSLKDVLNHDCCQSVRYFVPKILEKIEET